MSRWSDLEAKHDEERKALLQNKLHECTTAQEAADRLGIHRTHIYRLIDKYRLWTPASLSQKLAMQRECA